MPQSSVHYVYIAKCSDGTFYTGYAINVIEREKEHNGLGKISGAKYTRTRRPVKIIHTEKFPTRSNAMKRELEIKKLSRSKKQSLITNT